MNLAFYSRHQPNRRGMLLPRRYLAPGKTGHEYKRMNEIDDSKVEEWWETVDEIIGKAPNKTKYNSVAN